MSVSPLPFSEKHRFQLRAKLGEGGMGVVYEATDRQLQTRVAVKTLRTLSGDALLRLKNEFRALQDLHHENLVTLGELFEERGLWFFTMELVEGESLLEYVRPGDAAVTMPSTVEARERERTLDVWHAETSPAPATVPPPETPDPATFDEPRLRQSLVQIARGLSVLHAAGKVHRDIKPSNILCTAEGRVVILDFGLIASEGGADDARQRRLVGTASYMAPEQARALPVGPSADWYAVGAVLYEALTGRVPFVGEVEEVLDAKQRFDPHPPRRFVAGVPRDLDELCMRLLVRDPRVRPTAAEVLQLLGAEPMRLERTHGASFVGRQPELAALDAALQAARDGAVTVVVSGESGIGKSAVVRRFVDGLDEQFAVLAGRCYERETVPYKAIDGVVDELTQLLSALPFDEAAALLPRNAAALAHVFPVLGRLDALAQAAPSYDMAPREQRTRAVAVLRELLERLAHRRRVVVTIDDFQWADADSLELLEEVMRPPGAPPLLMVLTMRTTSDPEREAALPRLSGARRRLHLESLPRADAAALADRLREQLPDGGAVNGAAIADEAAGHPLFIGELVRRQVAAGAAPTPLKLEEALWARIGRLDPAAQHIVELVSVASGPLPPRAAAEAAGLGPMELARVVALLRTGHLLRTSGSALEPYHDRIRAAALAHLDDARRRELHHRLAVALEAAGGIEPERLAIHWQGAGDAAAAATYAARAADDAARALAFERAARLYTLARDLGRPTGEAARRLEANRGEALANAGRSVEAGEAFRAGAVGAPPEEALELRRRSAQQFLSGGRIDDGIAAIHEVLAAVDLKMAATPQRALLSLLAARARLRLRGLDFVERPEPALDPRQRMRIDVTYSVSLTLGAVDTIRGTDFQTRNLLFALEAGEPYRVARALLLEASFAALPGPSAKRRVDELLGRAEALTARIDHPHATAWNRLSRGYISFLQGRFVDAVAQFAAAEPIFRERCRDVAYELDSINLFSLWSRYYLGRIREVLDALSLGIAEARDRGDLSGMTNLRTRVAHVAGLAADDPARARAETEEALQAWSHSGFYAQHYYALYSQAQIDLYLDDGDGTAAVRRIDEARRALDRSLLLRVQFIQVEMLHLRARAALQAARRSDGDARRKWIAAARRDARRLAALRLGWGDPLAALLQAGVAALDGDAAAAVAQLARAADGCDAAELRLYAAVARRRRGERLGGDEGRALIAAADTWMTAQGIRNPSRLTAALAPGFD
jgi:hypothetical protein